MRCGSCGTEVAEGSRYCPSCGHALASRGDERRVATVVFADIVGFTSLAEAADPEQVKELVDRCFERLGADITAFGGKVDKIVGDALVALFGAPTAHEDDAERAVRAALRMQATVAAHAAEQGADLRVRIGVNTGEVLVGALRAGGEYTAMGDVVNTAQRLQTVAEPGAVVVGPATRAATGEAIAYRELGPVEVRGRDEPVIAFAALEPLLPPGYRPRRTVGPLVGRDHELALLDGSVAVAVRRRRAQLVVLVGEAGQGKSRLAAELAGRAAADHDARVLEGRCVPYGEANPFWPVAEALRHACRIRGRSTPAEAARATRLAAAEVLDLDEGDPEVQRLADGLGHLMGFDVEHRAVDPQRARDEARWAAVRYLEASARRAPLVLVLSDLHWAEPPVLELLADLLERLHRCPFVLLATTRDAPDERLVAGLGRHNVLALTLDPLDGDAAGVLLDALADRPLPSRLRDELLDRAGGNPLFLEELLALVTEGAAVGDGPTPVLAAPSALDDLPDTLRGLVAARIDALDEAARLVLEDAAVWGHAGKVAVLTEMGTTHPGLRLDEALTVLEDRDVLVLEADRWAFRSELVREVAYAMLTKSARARRHAGIAWYLDRGQPSPAEATDRTVDVVAHHYASAAALVGEVGAIDGLPRRLGSRALDWLEEAASRAERGLAHHLVRQLCTQALDLPTEPEPDVAADGDRPAADPAARRARLLLRRARAEASLRQLDDARCDVAEADALAGSVGDPLLGAQVLATRGDIEQKAGDLAASEATLVAAVDGFRAADDQRGAADALRLLGLTRIFAGDDAGAEAAITAALDTYRDLDDRRGVAWGLQNLAWISFAATRPDEAEARLNESIATFRQLGDEGGLVWADGLLAFVRYQRGDLEGAGELGAQVEREARARGDRWGQGMMQALQAGVELWSGRGAASVRHSREAQATFAAIGDAFGEVQAAVGLGRALVIVGDVDEGLDLLVRTAERVGGVADHVPVRTMAVNGLAAALVQLGEPERALAALGDGTDPVRVAGGIGDTERLVARALALVQLGRPDDALAVLGPAVAAASDHPSAYATSALALAAASAGASPAEVEAHGAGLVDGDDGSYLDRFAASLALALARCATAGADAVAELDALADAVATTDDRVAAAVVATARAATRAHLGLPGTDVATAEAAAWWAELGVDGHGWRAVIDQVLARGRRPAPTA